MASKGVKKICSRRHVFFKSSDCPICPICWSGYYRDNVNKEFPKEIPAPALRALLSAKITTLFKLSEFSESEVLGLHGMGRTSIPKLKKSLKEKGLKFKQT